MSRYWKAALPFLLAAVIILAAASRPVVLHIGFPCDSYWNVPGENYYTFIDAAIEKFEAEHPNVKVEYTSGIRVEDYTEWLSGQYLLGQEPDVMVILPEDFVIFSDTASLRELDPFMKQDPEADLSGFYPAALQAGADKGKQYALPLECVPQMMFINKTLLQKEHIRIPDNDWTWDEFYSLCEQLTRDTDGDGIVDQFGVYEVVFGMIMMTTVTFGVMTPPVGTALYAVSDIMECPIEETFKKGWPFYLAIVGVILFMIFFPQAVLFLPNLVYGA